MEFFSSLGRKITGTAQDVQEKTRDGIESTRISGELRAIRGEIRQLYAALGEMYYKTASSAAQGELKSVCDEIGHLEQRAEELTSRKNEISRKGHCPTCGRPVKNGSHYCPNCGTKIEAPESPAPRAEVCAACGAKRRPGVRFCTNCGAAFEAGETASVNLKNPAEETQNTEE